MARKKKVDLIEEARSLGLPAHEDEHYDDILKRIQEEKAERETLEVTGLDEEIQEREERVELVEDYYGEPVPDDDEVEEPEVHSTGYTSLGIWRGRGRPR